MTAIYAGTTATNAYGVSGDTSGNLVLQTNGTTPALTLTYAQNAILAGNLGVGTSSAPTIPFVAQSNTGSGTQRTLAQLNTYESTTGTGINLDFAQAGTTVGRIASNFVAAGQMGLQFSTYNSGLNTNMTLSQAGVLTTPNQPAFLAYGSVTVNLISGSPTYIAPNTLYNVGSYYNASTGAFTVPVAGVYIFGGMVRLDTSPGSYMYFDPAVNGTRLYSTYGFLPGLTGYAAVTGASGFSAGPTNFMLKLNANDAVTISIGSNGGTSSSAIDAQTFWYGRLLG